MDDPSHKADMGGPAFPVPMTMDDKGNFHHSAEHPDNIGGMTLWDYYAAAALPAFIAHPGCPPEEWAESAAAQADAMLAERAKRTEGK